MVLAMLSIQAIPIALASNTSRGNPDSSASDIFTEIIKDANAGNKVQNTALDNASKNKNPAFDERYWFANTVENLRQEIAPYLNWFLYAALSAATILIIITGLQLVTSSTWSYDFKKASTRLKNIAIWVAIFTGVYAIIQIFLAVFKYFLK